MSMKLGRKAITIRANGTPLTVDQLRESVPAIFHDKQGVTTLPVYGHINTAQVIAAFMQEGWQVSEAAQTGALREVYRLEQKHYVRLRREGDFSPHGRREYVPEIIIVNAHNASSKLHMLAGLWRFVCSNGLMVGQTVEAMSYFHRHGAITQIMEGAHEIAQKKMPLVLEQVKHMQEKKLTAPKALAMAEQAFALRWPDGSRSVTAADLVQPRREQDQPNDAWHVFNRIQENVMHGGFALASGGGRTVQPLTQVNDVVAINRRLWDMALAA